MLSHINQPWWLLAPLALLILLWATRRRALPGGWSKLIAPPLRSYLAHTMTARQRSGRRPLLWLLWLLLAAMLAQISIEQSETPELSNLYARVLVVDLGVDPGDAESGLAPPVAAARRLIERSAQIPTGVVAVSSEAFDVVPLTTDQAHLDRYLRVLDSAAMPVGGRAPARGVARAEALLQRSGILARQIVLFSSGPPPAAPAAPVAPADTGLWLVVDAERRALWRDYADAAAMRLIDESDTALSLADLAQRRADAAADIASARQRRELTPWLIALALPLWLLVFFRPQSV